MTSQRINSPGLQVGALKCKYGWAFGHFPIDGLKAGAIERRNTFPEITKYKRLRKVVIGNSLSLHLQGSEESLINFHILFNIFKI